LGRLTVVDAARDAGVPLDEARRRFPVKTAILLKLGGWPMNRPWSMTAAPARCANNCSTC
jgi:hypothetical protein